MSENTLIPVCVGLDISTSCTGVILLEEQTGNFIKMFAIKLTSSKLKDVYDKVDYAVDTLLKEINLNHFDVKQIFIEEAAKKFTPGFSSANTLFSLARFNGIISNEVRKLFGPKPIMINVRSARKVLGLKINYKDKSTSTKTKIFEAVKSINPHFTWETHIAKTGKRKGQLVFGKQNEDLADAWVICQGGSRLSGNLK